MRYVTFFRPANLLQTCKESRLDVRRQLREITDFALVNILMSGEIPLSNISYIKPFVLKN